MAGFAKAYALPFDYVLYELSFANLTMYSAVLPSYDSKKDGDGKKGKPQKDGIEMRMDDPRNNDRIRQLFQTFRD